MSIKNLIHFSVMALCLTFMAPSYADERSEALLKLLQTPAKTYQLDQTPYQPVKIQSVYSVTWLRPPIYRATQAERNSYKQATEMKMVVSAGTGEIVQSQVTQSSGSQSLDQKIMDALTRARLEPIRGVDRNLVYEITYQFQLENPL